MGLGHKDWAAADVLTASDLDGYLMAQALMVFATTTARDTALSGSLEEGMVCYTEPGNNFWFYDGSAWVPFMSTWASFTPAWTNLSIGNATVVAELRYVGSEMRCRGVMTFGSTTSVTGTPIQITIPESKTSRATGGGSIGHAYYVDSSVSNKPYGGWSIVSQNDTLISFLGNDDNYTAATTPFTWATGDTLRWDVLIALA